ncbi:histidine phosphatase family protein [Kutzneria kofuensis]|uniref:Putative phosphoglycerate mutase n=1 Tax=Kutzneria kofuensis TaxID=103725 RepID=A0A7W9KE73_9PSEU|nr:histidine phosphatase family protein [Kutzneria kofuensis]MBB5890984.1 putative phosphoglycerate mutase [Kutzneria kofuensis]
MARLLLVRHGESDHTLRGPEGLTSAGRRQAAALADRLAAEERGPVAVYSSTEVRAIETAAVISDRLGVTPTRDCGLCTWHTPPEATGLTSAEFQQRFGIEGGGVFRPFETGNEAWADLVTRVSRTLLELAARHRDETVIAVGHTETVEASFAVFGNQPLLRDFDVAVAPASITEWTTDGDPTAWPPPRWTLHRLSA